MLFWSGLGGPPRLWRRPPCSSNASSSPNWRKRVTCSAASWPASASSSIPNRDAEQYLKAAEAEGVRIAHITETHIHADYLSGSRELAARTGATLYVSDEGDAGWKYAFAGEPGVTLIKDGDRITVGNIRIDVVPRRGTRRSTSSFLVTDGAAADEPIAAATGDFIFVGDVGRPDLLERAANIKGTMEAGARTLYRSLQKFAARPDWLQIWPGHGAGSACGKGISADPAQHAGVRAAIQLGAAACERSRSS